MGEQPMFRRQRPLLKLREESPAEPGTSSKMAPAGFLNTSEYLPDRRETM